MRRIKEFLKNRVQEASKNQKGFSLVELIIVIAILGVIAAIAIPNVTTSVQQARINTDITNARAIANALQMAKAKDEAATLDKATAEAELGAFPTPKAKTGATEFKIEGTDFNNIRITVDEVEVYPNSSAYPGN